MTDFGPTLLTVSRRVWDGNLNPNLADATPPKVELTAHELAVFKRYDWRVWLGWSSTFQGLASRYAMLNECGDHSCAHTVAIVALWNSVGCMQACGIEAHKDGDELAIGSRLSAVTTTLRSTTVPEMFESVGHAWWNQYRNRVLPPELQWSDETFDLELTKLVDMVNQVFPEVTDVHTLLGAAYLSGVLAIKLIPYRSPAMREAALAACCLSASALYRIAYDDVINQQMHLAIQAIFGGDEFPLN